MQDKALLKYGDKQCLAYIKGVGDAFAPMTHFDTLIREGKFFLKNGDVYCGEFGRGVAEQLGIGSSDGSFNSISCYAPRRGINNSSINPEDAITQMHLYRSGIFSINDDFDGRYVIVSIDFARELFDYHDKSVSSIELGLDNTANSSSIKEQLKTIVGKDFVVKDRYEQNELLFKTLKPKSVWTFIILAFILVIATFQHCLPAVHVDNRQTKGYCHTT